MPLSNYLGFNDVNGQVTVIPGADAMLDTVQNEWSGVVGDQVQFDESSFEGAIVAAQANSRLQALYLYAERKNALNLQRAGGDDLDNLGIGLGSYRAAGTPSTVSVTFTKSGSSSVTITSGFQAADSNGNVFVLQDTIIISGQTASGTMQRSVVGAVSVAANSLTQILTPVAGLASITNPLPAVVGLESQSDDSYRNQILTQSGKNGYGFIESIQSAIGQLIGVTGQYIDYNDSAISVTRNGVTIPANSVFLCVAGGVANDIAKAIYSKKAPGIPTSTGTGVTVISYQNPTNQQTYSYNIFRPTQVVIYVAVTVRQDGGITDVFTAIKTALTNYINSLNIGIDVSQPNLIRAVTTAYPSLSLQSLYLGISPSPTAVTPIEISAIQRAVISAANINVVVV